MAESSLVGYDALKRRIAAVSGRELGPEIMQTLGLATVREAKLRVHRKTGTTGRSIHLSYYSATEARVTAGFAAAFLEHGTRPHEITPRARRALAWAATPAGRRLTGSARVAARRGALGGMVFAARVHHPGTKPAPFLLPGGQAALDKSGLASRVVAAWNKAR